MGVELRFGRVSSIGAKAHTVRVEFSEVDGVESYDLPVLVTRPGDFALPAGQPQAACLMNEGAEGVGVVLGFIYSESDAPPLDDAGKRAVESDDLRLGAHDATDAVALAPATKDELDAIKSELDAIKTALSSHTHLAGALASPAGPVTGSTAPSVDHGYNVGYTPTEPAAEKVKAK